MTYYKVDMTHERSSSEINDFHYGEKCAEGIAKYGDLDLTGIKTLYAEEKNSWPVPVDFEAPPHITEDEYYKALDDIECDHGFTGIVYGVETKSGDFIDMREAPLPLSIETPYGTLETLEVNNNEELFAKMDGDLLEQSMSNMETNNLQQ